MKNIFELEEWKKYIREIKKYFPALNKKLEIQTIELLEL